MPQLVTEVMPDGNEFADNYKHLCCTPACISHGRGTAFCPLKQVYKLYISDDPRETFRAGRIVEKRLSDTSDRILDKIHHEMDVAEEKIQSEKR